MKTLARAKPENGVIICLALMWCHCHPGQGGSLAELTHQRLRDSQDLRDLAQTQPKAVAQAMGQIQSPLYLPDLMALLSVPDAQAAAIFSIGQIAIGQIALNETSAMPGGGPAKDAGLGSAPNVLVALEPHLQAQPVLVTEALGKWRLLPPPAAIEHADPAVRSAAAVALWRGRGERYSDHALHLLRRLAADADGEVRARVAFALSKPFESRATDVMILLLKDTNPLARLYAVRGLAQAQNQSREELLRALGPLELDADDKVRVEALQALVALEAGDRVASRHCSDPNVFVRMAVASVCASAWTDASNMVRRQAALAEAKKPTLSERLAALLRAANPLDRLTLADALGAEARRDDALPVLRTLIGDGDERVQSAALASLKTVNQAERTRLALTALSSPLLSVRAVAFDLLSTSTDDAVRDAVRAAYRQSLGDEWIDLREQMVDAFLAWGDVGSLRTVLGSDPCTKVRARAGRALKAPPLVVDRGPLAELTSFAARPRYDLVTSKGTLVLELFSDHAPQHVSSFDQLVQRHFYDGLLWHRVVPNFVVQGGDPRGDGWGNGGVAVDDEINPLPFVRGTLGMPNSGKDTGGCQFFITHIPTPHLDGRYTVFGQVVGGLEVLDILEVSDQIVAVRRL